MTISDDPFDRGHQHRVGELERRVERHAGNELEELVVLDDDRGVTDAAEPLQAVLGLLHACRAFARERKGDDPHREGARFLRETGHEMGRTGAGPAPHASGHEDDVGPVEEGAKLFLVLTCGLLSDLGARAGAETLGGPAADEDLPWGVDGQEVLGIGIDRAHLRALDALIHATVDRVRSATTASDDPDVDPERLRQLCELGVVGIHVRRWCRFLVVDQRLALIVLCDRFLNDGLHRSVLRSICLTSVVRPAGPILAIAT